MKAFVTFFSIAMILASCSLHQKTPVQQNPITPDTTKTETVTPAPTTPATTDTAQPTTPTAATTYTLEQVAEHSTGADCWLILDNKVYDVTSFIPNHPGGEAILRGCGKDATKMFAKHPESAKQMKEKFFIGDIK